MGGTLDRLDCLLLGRYRARGLREDRRSRGLLTSQITERLLCSVNLNEVALSESTIKQGRLKAWEEISEEHYQEFPFQPIETGESQHWDFVTEETWDFFKIQEVPVDWLTWPPVK